MKIISLNTWGGRAGDIILDFFKKYRDVDIFLLQEVHHHGTGKTMLHPGQMGELFIDIQKILSSHVGYFAPAEADEWGLAAFIRKDIPVQEAGDIFVHRWKNAYENDGSTLGKNLQYFKIIIANELYTIMNFHGLWNGKGKTDTDDRIEQSKNIRRFMDALVGDRKILCGDFNLMPDTQSLAILAEGMRDLIKEYGVTSTRSHFYAKEIKFADYALVSPGIHIKDFKVLNDAVSDHLALYLEFE